MGNSKVIFGNETLIDLTGDTVTPDNLLAGTTAHNRSGEQIVGTATVPEELDDLTDVTLTSPAEGDLLQYNGTSGEWENSNSVPQKLDSIPRPNLLKNWNFSNPVNTQGKSSYTVGVNTYTHCIDEWVFTNGNVVNPLLSLANSRITMSHDETTGTNYAMGFQQFLDDELYNSIIGKTVTISLLLDDGQLVELTGIAPTVKHSQITKYFTYNGIQAYIGFRNNRDADNYFFFVRVDTLSAVSISMLAAKVEFGEGQTLCHKENGVWVLNEVENTEPWQNTNQIAAMQEAGAVNHLDVDAVSQVVRGITYTVNANKSVTINGTNTDAGQSVLRLDTDFKDCSALSGKNAVFGGFNVGIPAINGYAQCYFYDSSNTEVARITARWADSGVLVPSNAVKYRAALFISSGATINNVTVYPMLYDARLVNPPYQPFTMTNRELTDVVEYQKGDVYSLRNHVETSTDGFYVNMGFVSTTRSSISIYLPLDKPLNKQITGCSVSANALYVVAYKITSGSFTPINTITNSIKAVISPDRKVIIVIFGFSDMSVFNCFNTEALWIRLNDAQLNITFT